MIFTGVKFTVNRWGDKKNTVNGSGPLTRRLKRKWNVTSPVGPQTVASKRKLDLVNSAILYFYGCRITLDFTNFLVKSIENIAQLVSIG